MQYQKKIEINSRADLTTYIKFLIKRNWRLYSNFYLMGGHDIDDIEQEINIVFFQVLKKYKDKPIKELSKILCGAACNKLNSLRVKNPQTLIIKDPERGNVYSVIKEIEEIGDTIEGNYDKPDLAEEALKEFCRIEKIENFYPVFIKIFLENRTCNECNKIFNFPKKTTQKLIRAYKKKLTEYFKNDK